MMKRCLSLGITGLVVAFGLVIVPAANAATSTVTKAVSPVKKVTITLRDHGFGFHNIAIRALATRLTVVNRGSKPHALYIRGPQPSSKIRLRTAAIKPGASAQVSLRLSNGRYLLFSPGDHQLSAALKWIQPGSSGPARAETDRVFYNY